MRRRHWVALDCVIGAVAALCTVIPAMSEARAQLGPFSGRILLTLLLIAAVFVPVGFRRVRPVPAFGALVLLAVVMYALTMVHASLVVLLSATYALYIVIVEASRRTGTAALGLALAAALAISLGGYARSGVATYGAVPVMLVLVICWMIGYAVRQRRRYAHALQQQAASKAVTEERLRIARELHDVVAHSMSVIAVQAGFGQYVIDSNPSDAREALGAIQATSRDALEEMRRMLGVLRQQDIAAASGGPPATAPAPPVPTAPLAPAPGLARLDRLIERTSGTGVQVRLERSGAVSDVPAGVDLSAYRIIQEALTNVVKHAGGDACCTVRVRFTNEALSIEVADDGGGAPAGAGSTGSTAGAADGESGGHGIIGMRERAALCGGSLEAGPAPDGGFRVTATLPLHGAAAAPAAGSVTAAGPGVVLPSSVMAVLARGDDPPDPPVKGIA
jgi:signal transduction histidine kinase